MQVATFKHTAEEIQLMLTTHPVTPSCFCAGCGEFKPRKGYIRFEPYCPWCYREVMADLTPEPWERQRGGRRRK